MLEMLSDYMPAVMHLSPVTMVGAGIGAFGGLLYLLTRIPELLLVVGTSLLYAVVPLLHGF